MTPSTWQSTPSVWQSLRQRNATVSLDGAGVFHIDDGQMDCTSQGIIVGNCVHNDAGGLALTDDKQGEDMGRALC